MNRTAPARAVAPRVPRLVLVGVAIVIAAIIGILGHQPASSSATSSGDRSPSVARSVSEIPGSAAVGSSPVSTSAWDGRPPRDVERGPKDAGRGEQPGRPAGPVGQAGRAPLPDDHLGALGEADGLVPDGASVFDDETPAVANLVPSLLEALRRAATDAAGDGIELQVNSGWRSPEYQEQLLREAVSEYGSEEEAARWVATANTSAHVSGEAVDLRSFDATTWLSERGAHYGLCQIYRNEPWHFELRPEAASRGCPPMFGDPTDDPRMQQ